MRIITVSGEHSEIGKTTVAELLLNQLKNWSALKVTVIKDGDCPRKKSCGVCARQNRPFSIISGSRVINRKGKDTRRLKAAGAKKVLWLKARMPGLEDGLKKALKRFKGADGVIVEGTSVLKYLKPDLGIFIAEKSRKKAEGHNLHNMEIRINRQ